MHIWTLQYIIFVQQRSLHKLKPALITCVSTCISLNSRTCTCTFLFLFSQIRFVYPHFTGTNICWLWSNQTIYPYINVLSYDSYVFIYKIWYILFWLSQILISCFVKTSHFEEYLCVKVRILLIYVEYAPFMILSSHSHNF